MGKFPFTVRPIKLDEAIVKTDPISIPNDLSGKMTLSSKHASVQLQQFTDSIREKDISQILANKGDEEIILSTNTILEISRAKDIEDTSEETKYFAVYILVGFFAGVILLSILHENISLLFILVSAVAILLGGMSGFVFQKFYEAKLKKSFQEWIRQFLEE